MVKGMQRYNKAVSMHTMKVHKLEIAYIFCIAPEPETEALHVLPK
jgi:hypothetical protein